MRNTNSIFSNSMTRFVIPPRKTTVIITITEVVVKINCLDDVDVFRIARPKAKAPLSPEKKIKFWFLNFIFVELDRVKFTKYDNGYILTALPNKTTIKLGRMNPASH